MEFHLEAPDSWPMSTCVIASNHKPRTTTSTAVTSAGKPRRQRGRPQRCLCQILRTGDLRRLRRRRRGGRDDCHRKQCNYHGGEGNYSAAAVWDVVTRDKIQRRGGRRRGKALLAEFLPSLRRRSPGRLTRRLDDASHSPQSSRRSKCDFISLMSEVIRFLSFRSQRFPSRSWVKSPETETTSLSRYSDCKI